jgi:hypothetical protein
MPECATDRTNRADVPPARQWRVQTPLAGAGWALMLAAGLCLPAAKLAAQPATEPATPAETPAPIPEPQPVVGSPPAPEPTVHASTPAAEPALAEPQPISDPEPAKEPPKPAGPTLKIGMGVRSGLALTVNSPSDNVELSLHDGLFDVATVRPYFSSQLTEHIGVTANFDIESSGFNLLDAIIQLKFIDELQLWVGQHLPAQDRNNFCGPYFNNSWNFAVTIQAYPMDFAARDRGFTFWGLIAGGIVKYHLSLVDLQPGRDIANSRLGGRVTLNLLDKENYYYSSGTYFGAQDTLALGVAFQYQNGLTSGTQVMDRNGDGEIDNDFVGVSADLLFEKNLGSGGTITLEGGYWNFDGSGADYVANQGINPVTTQFSGPQPGQSVLGAISWLTPKKIGIGQLQPNFRLQWANQDAGDVAVYDIGLAYVIDGFNNRWHFNYRHVDPKGGGDSTDMLQLGAQLQI